MTSLLDDIQDAFRKGGKSAGAGSGIQLVPPDDRPQIKIGPDIARMTRMAIASLRDDDETFQRAGMLVHVGRIDSEDQARTDRLPIGSPVIHAMTRATLRARLSQSIRWVTWSVKDGEGQWKETKPDPDATSATLEARVWPGVRYLVGVTETPVIRRDGSVLQRPGFDPTTGYLYLPSERYPSTRDDPSETDARDALAQLREPFSDFPFTSDVARDVLVAAILTAFARAAIVGAVPAFGHDASTRGSGKTLAADIVSLIACGRSSRTTYPGDEEELRKVLDGYAIGGASVIVIDNVVGPFGGAALDAYLTAHDTVDVRVLGSTGQHTVPWRGLLLITGNNLDPRGDTPRRMLVARLEPTSERPENRTDFRHSVLRDYVLAARPRLVCAALTLLRAFFVAKRPDMGCGPWGSFEAWSTLIPRAILFAGGTNVLDARMGSTESTDMDPDVAALSTLLDSFPRLSDRPIRARDVVDALYPGGRQPAPDEPPDGFDDLRDALEHLTRCPVGRVPGSRQAGEAFRRLRGRWLGGRRLAGSTSTDDRIVRWRVEKQS